MTEQPKSIDTPRDALLFCDYLAKFGSADVSHYYAELASVIRDLTRRLEMQAIAAERAEAREKS